MMKRIAAVTMVRDDAFFLERWIRYYGREIGEANLFVLLDGLDEELPSSVADRGITVTKLPHRTLSRVAGDKYRIGELNHLAERLLAEGYEMVIGTDADEFILPDPQTGQGLADFLSALPPRHSYSPLGVDLGQHLRLEPSALDPEHSILAQRHYALLHHRYTKVSIKTDPTPWGSGFHRLRRAGYRIVPDLFLVHTGNCDLELLRAKMGDSARGQADWQQHLQRRAETITRITDCETPQPADDLWDKVRRRQQRTHLPWAWGKPYTLGKVPVVQLPERFAEISI